MKMQHCVVGRRVICTNPDPASGLKKGVYKISKVNSDSGLIMVGSIDSWFHPVRFTPATPLKPKKHLAFDLNMVVILLVIALGILAVMWLSRYNGFIVPATAQF